MQAMLDFVHAVTAEPEPPCTPIEENIYQQSTGRFTNTVGTVIAIGYSGRGAGLNNPEMQRVAMNGPIPQGEYEIGSAINHPKLGPLAMSLRPSPDQELFGRSGFFIHGDNQLMNHTASEGCIILPHDARATIAASKNRKLRVIA